MPMIVANNLNAISAQRNLNINNSKMSGSLEKLSSGYRINSGKDDPSGLVISEQLRAQTVGLQRAVQNTQEANNVLGIAEGALNEMNNILKKMRQLAIHSANNGVTSPEQVAADQAEVDSSIQTLDRIARTTKFSDQFLLNGNKQLNYESSVTITDSQDMKLIDEGLSDVRQIFKREGFKLNVNFSGSGKNESNQDIDNGNEAQKGYFEITNTYSAATQVNYDTAGSTSNYTLTKDQAFTISGNQGSRYLSFAKETHLGEVVSAVNNVVDSTGVKATLIFDAQIGREIASNGSTDFSGAAPAARANQDINIYVRDAQGNMIKNTATTGVANATGFADANGITTAQTGINCDGDGRLYLKMQDDINYTIYKDEAMTMAVAEGQEGGAAITALNNSGLEGFSLGAGDSFLNAGDSAVIQVDGILENSTGSFNRFQGISFANISTDLSTSFNSVGSCVSGIRLGENTSETGKIYTKINSDGTNVEVFMYKDERMREEDLVAQSSATDVGTNAGFSAVQVKAVLAENGQSSGLYATLNLDAQAAGTILGSAGTVTTTIDAENLAVRISTKEYGSNEFVTIDQHEGAIFSRYDEVDGAELLDAGLSGAKWSSYGRDATISLNGQELKLDGIKGEVTNLDATATLVFNEGSLGNTTIATVGYDVGAWASRAGQIYADEDNYAVHALHSTTEVLGDWTGGMQFQLGEGAGDQERTVFSLKSMTATDMGRVTFKDTFGEDNFATKKTLSINDMLSGGLASLAADPIKSLSIIDKAIEDVSNLRAQIGAFQANMLQTNANSLNVAIENITKTESYIRDADMAVESTQFSKNQIMVQAGTSMLAQANGLAQSALSLIS